MSAGTIVSLVIGAWGAGLSTYLAWRMMRRDRRSLKVMCEIGYDARQTRGLQQVIAVTAVNDGHRPVQVTRLVFWLDDGQPIHSMPPADKKQPELPVMLGDGESVTLSYDWEVFRRIEKEEDRKVVRVTVYDAGLNDYNAPVQVLAG